MISNNVKDYDWTTKVPRKKREKIREIPKQYFEDNKGRVPKMNGDRYRGLYEEEDRLKRGYDRK